jgi:hypothetical protein
MEREHEREHALKEMLGYREMDREMSGLGPRTTSLGVTDAIVSELFATARSQFRDFPPRDEPIPKDHDGALNYVRGEPDKATGRGSPYPSTSPAIRAHYKPENEDGRPQPRLISPAAFEPQQPQYAVQVSPNDFALHSTIVHEEILFDYNLSKVSTPVLLIC